MREEGFYWLCENYKIVDNEWTIARFSHSDVLGPYWEKIGDGIPLSNSDLLEYYTIGDKIPSPCS